MAWPCRSLYFDKVIEIELAQKRAVVVVLKIFGEEDGSKLLRLVDCEDGATGQPTDELWMLLLFEDKG